MEHRPLGLVFDGAGGQSLPGLGAGLDRVAEAGLALTVEERPVPDLVQVDPDKVDLGTPAVGMMSGPPFRRPRTGTISGVVHDCSFGPYLLR